MTSWRLSPQQIEQVALALLRPNNERLSRGGRELRFGRKGSLSVDLDTGRFYDFENDEGGGLLDLVIMQGEARDLREARDFVRRITGSSGDPLVRSAPSAADADVDAEKKRALARQLFADARPVSGTLAEKYLIARAINPPYPPSLRFHPRVYNTDVKRDLPALIAAITPLDAPETINAVQRIWLAHPGRKADVPMSKKTLGPVLSGGVLLGTIGAEIVIGEGIETTMSAIEAFGIPGVATLGTSNMAKLAVPAHVTRVIIAHDRDESGVGRDAAIALARRLWAQRVEVRLAPPSEGSKDWNDAAQAKVKRAGGAHG